MSNIYELIKSNEYALSQSRLKSLLGDYYNPQSFLESEDRDPGEAQSIGLVYECLITNPLSFDDQFIISDFRIDNTSKAKQVINYIFEQIFDIKTWMEVRAIAGEFADSIEYYMSMDKDKRFNKIWKDNLEYIKARWKLVRNDKVVITPEELDKCEMMAANTLASSKCKEYFPKPGEYIEVIDQMKLEWDYMGVKCKGYADRVIIDHLTKSITLIDFKSGAQGFLKSYRQHRYDIQGAFYQKGLAEIYPGYEVHNPIFIYCPSYGTMEPTVWHMSGRDVSIAMQGIQKWAKYSYYDNDKYDTFYIIEGVNNLITKYKTHIERDNWVECINDQDNKGKRIINLWN